MLGFIIVGLSFIGALWIWIGGIRPFLRRHGVAVITAASWGMSSWGDYQQCRAYAIKEMDSTALRLCRGFLATQIGLGVGFILIACGG
jgi:hypothetical protein